jgi:hypothetical protein
MISRLTPSSIHKTHCLRRISSFFFLSGTILVAVALFHASTTNLPLPVTPAQVIPASLFGMHIHHMVVPDGKNPLTPWPSIPVREWRLWDAYTMWPYLEPAKGRWYFETLDKSLQMAEEHGTGVILTLGLTPRWASARPNEPSAYQPGFAAEPRDIEDWRTYVRTVAGRYRGRIHIYEIGNEPNLKHFWTGTTEQMVELTREAHDIIKSIDPTALIISPSATRTYGLTWLADFLRKGGGQYVDVIGFHLYVTPQPPEVMVALAQKVKQVMFEYGVGNKPLWDTESSWMPPSHFESGSLAAGYLARAYILLWSQGVERFYWYAWDNHRTMSLQLTASDSETLTEAGRAYLTTQKWLIGARMDWCNDAINHTWTCQLNYNGSLRWIVWNPDENKRVYVPPSWNIKHAVPLLGTEEGLEGGYVEIGPVPVLLTQN